MAANSSGYVIRMSAEASVFLATFTSLQTFFGSTANLIVIITIVASRELRRRSEDRLILNLAVADFLALTVFLPLHTYVLSQRYMAINVYRLYEPLNTLVLSTGGNTIFGIGVDTSIAVVFPFRHKEIMTNRATSVMIILSWTIATALATLASLRQVSMLDNTVTYGLVISYVSILLFGLPLLYIVIFYYARKQARAISNERRNFAAECSHQSHRLILKSATTTLGLVILFYVTYLPMAIYIAYLWVKKLSPETEASDVTWIFSFLFLNSCVNPFAYALRTKRFKTAFHKNIWPNMFHRNKRLRRIEIRARFYISNYNQRYNSPEVRIEDTSF